MDEDCISMRNDPIDPLETVDGMQFEADAAAKQSKIEAKSSSKNFLNQMEYHEAKE